MADSELDQALAAVTELRGMVAKTLGLDDERPTRGSSLLFEVLWSAYGKAPRCSHLNSRPIQPSMMTLPHIKWRCRSCMTKFAESMRGKSLGPIEEFTCDWCRRYVQSSLTPMIIRQDLWMVVLSVCHQCEQFALSQGAKST